MVGMAVIGATGVASGAVVPGGIKVGSGGIGVAGGMGVVSGIGVLWGIGVGATCAKAPSDAPPTPRTAAQIKIVNHLVIPNLYPNGRPGLATV